MKEVGDMKGLTVIKKKKKDKQESERKWRAQAVMFQLGL